MNRCVDVFEQPTVSVTAGASSAYTSRPPSGSSRRQRSRFSKSPTRSSARPAPVPAATWGVKTMLARGSLASASIGLFGAIGSKVKLSNAAPLRWPDLRAANRVLLDYAASPATDKHAPSLHPGEEVSSEALFGLRKEGEQHANHVAPGKHFVHAGELDTQLALDGRRELTALVVEDGAAEAAHQFALTLCRSRPYLGCR